MIVVYTVECCLSLTKILSGIRSLKNFMDSIWNLVHFYYMRIQRRNKVPGKWHGEEIAGNFFFSK